LNCFPSNNNFFFSFRRATDDLKNFEGYSILKLKFLQEGQLWVLDIQILNQISGLNAALVFQNEEKE